MKPELLPRCGYTKGTDGKWRKPVSFDVPKRPGVVNRVNIVRAADGTLLKSETIGWLRLPTPAKK